MRTVIAALLIAGCSPGEPVVATTPLDVKPVPSTSVASRPVAAVKEKTVFTKRAPAVGDRHEETEQLLFSMSLVTQISGAPPQHSDLNEKAHTTKRLEVLAVNEGTPTKVRATYLHATNKDGPTPIDGKSYVVENKNGVVVVRDPKGAEPDIGEQLAVVKDWSSLGKPDPLATGLPTTRLSPGDRVDSMAHALAEYIDRESSSGLKVSDVDVTFRGRAGDTGAFDIAMTMSKSDSGMSFRVTLTGELRVLVKGGQPTAMTLTGPLAISAPDPQAGFSVEGSGAMTISMTTTP